MNEEKKMSRNLTKGQQSEALTDKQKAEARKVSEANTMYRTLCSALDNMQWRYEKAEDELVVRTSAVGKDLTMKLYIKVDSARSVMYLKSSMPFDVPAERIPDMAQAAIMANWSMLNGSFEMDMSDGYVAFKMVVPFMESLVSEKVCRYMISVSCDMIDKYNDKFLALTKGTMTLDEFRDFSCKAL
ncbi:MAG: YbjN domain-containing protein [Corallococcus sp.]|nr:YbjN domain-containing protein [Bacillota bacterium]MCM1534205.1 YbjN domain-containing protein [Corallococcus sp.]